MRRRVEQYRRFHEGFGDIMVQLNVEDTRLGVAEYVIEKLGVDTIELKWGQGAKCIGGEIKVDSVERALELQKRGYLVTPDPSDGSNVKAYKDGAIKEFERHSRIGFLDQNDFMREVDRIRKLGAKRVTLKTGAYPMRELAMAIRWASDAKISLVTIDGAPGGTGMSPWRMMSEWGCRPSTCTPWRMTCVCGWRRRAPGCRISPSRAVFLQKTTSSRRWRWGRLTAKRFAWDGR
jgi:glutamate synthase domain-containing protein 2